MPPICTVVMIPSGIIPIGVIASCFVSNSSEGGKAVCAARAACEERAPKARCGAGGLGYVVCFVMWRVVRSSSKFLP